MRCGQHPVAGHAPGRNASVGAAGSTASVSTPGTPGPSGSPALLLRPSPPTGPESQREANGLDSGWKTPGGGAEVGVSGGG